MHRECYAIYDLPMSMMHAPSEDKERNSSSVSSLGASLGVLRSLLYDHAGHSRGHGSRELFSQIDSRQGREIIMVLS